MKTESNYDYTSAVFSAATKLVGGLGERLSAEIKGQEYAINCVKETLFQAFTMKEQNYQGPKASIMFVGAPGVGKTQMAQTTAEYLGLPFMRVDMSGFADKEEALFNFRGLNESYKASRPGDVTSFVDEHPDAVLLLDEVDKAHQNVKNLLLQIFEGGELEDACMRKKVSFRNTIIFMTTNVGAQLFESLDRCNYATLPEKKVLDAMEKEINPATNSPWFSSAMVSRFAKGTIVPFNRLNGQQLCAIAEAKAQKLSRRFMEKYPNIRMVCDFEGLAKSLLFAKGSHADARNLTGAVEHFISARLFEAMEKYEENDGDLAKVRAVEYEFHFSDGEERVQRLFDRSETCKVAVFCDEEERAVFAPREGVHFEFVAMDDKVNSLDYDCAIVGVDLTKNERGMQFFRKVKLEDDIPVHVFSLNMDSDETDMKAYHCEGAESAYIAKRGVHFDDWLNDIVAGMQLSQTVAQLARANLILYYDTLCSYEETDEGVVLKVKAVNYRLERAVYAEDEGTMLASHEIPNVKFDDVKGLDSTVTEVKDLMKYFKDYKKYTRLGVRIPRGVLLVGPPGTGKTLLAKAIAGESGLPIFQKNAGDFFRPYWGQTEMEIRKTFSLARKYAPSFIFIDEVDSIAKKRGQGDNSEVMDRALNILLSEMDGFIHDDKKPVFVMAATNSPVSGDEKNALDAAFVRRFDRSIQVKLPDAQSRMEILQYYLGKHDIVLPELKLKNIVQRSPGKSPADIEQIVEYAVRQAEGKTVQMQDLEEAFETIAYGDKKKWDEATVKKTSYHEAGHALVAWLTGNTPAYVTNISRGGHGGYMQYDSEEDKLDYTRQELLDKICVAFAGRAAERLVYGEKGLTTGAGADVKQARKLAFALVDEYAMEEDFLLGVSDMQSEKTKQWFDEKANALLKEQSARATELLAGQRDRLERLVETLLRENSLNMKEIEDTLASFDDEKRDTEENKGGVA